MGVYHSKEELERILSRLWERIFSDPQIVSNVADAKLVAKFRYTDFPSELFIDLKKEHGSTLVLVTHNPEIARAADRVLTLKDGHLTG